MNVCDDGGGFGGERSFVGLASAHKDCGCSEGRESGKDADFCRVSKWEWTEVSAGVGEDDEVVVAGNRRRRWRGVCECEVGWQGKDGWQGSKWVSLASRWR